MTVDPKLKRELEEFAAGVDVKPDVGGRCPCGGIFLAAKENLSAYHTLPVCQEFEKNDPADYLNFVRVRLSQ